MISRVLSDMGRGQPHQSNARQRECGALPQDKSVASPACPERALRHHASRRASARSRILLADARERLGAVSAVSEEDTPGTGHQRRSGRSALRQGTWAARADRAFDHFLGRHYERALDTHGRDRAGRLLQEAGGWALRCGSSPPRQCRRPDRHRHRHPDDRPHSPFRAHRSHSPGRRWSQDRARSRNSRGRLVEPAWRASPYVC